MKDMARKGRAGIQQHPERYQRPRRPDVKYRPVKQPGAPKGIDSRTWTRLATPKERALAGRALQELETQFNKIQRLIETGVKEGATLVTGGPGRPAGLDRGYYVKPTVFADVKPDMTIAREEIFGPVLSILPYDTEQQAIDLANDSVYGLAGYVSSGSPDNARRVASALRAGQITINGAPGDVAAPFGGYKQSGNGREWGKYGFEEFLEVKAVMGY